MNITFITFLIVCPLVFLAGFVDSIAGGGGLISLPAYLIAGLPPINASATNKVSAFMGTTISTGNYFLKGYMNIVFAIPGIISAIIFSSIGAKIQTLIPEQYLKIFMLIALPITLLFTLNKKSFKDTNKKINVGRKELLLTILISIIFGFYDGLYGPGTGTFLILFFVNIVKFNVREANGLGKAINLSTNLGSLIYFLYAGKAIILLGVVAGIFNMLGCFIGSNLFSKKGISIARPIMILVMIIFMVKLILELML